jgi:hypothetical protein
VQTTHAYRSEPDASPASALLSQRWYWNYVLGALTLCSLRYALVIIGVVNLWAALHYWLSSRTVRADLEETERLARA